MGDPGNPQAEDRNDLYKICLSFRQSIRTMLKKALELSTAVTEEQFLSELIGRCPRCGSLQTKDCEHVKEIEDFTVALCTECSHLWCVECGRPLVKNTSCSHWEICRKCGTVGKAGFCGNALTECAKLNDR